MDQSGRGRRDFSSDFKTRVIKDAMCEADTLEAVAFRRGVHPSQVKEWRRQFEEGGRKACRSGVKREADQAAIIKEPCAKIGKLTMEGNFFQERWGDEPSRTLGLGLQERLIGRVPPADLVLMRRIDELHTESPFHGCLPDGRRVAAGGRHEGT